MCGNQIVHYCTVLDIVNLEKQLLVRNQDLSRHKCTLWDSHFKEPVPTSTAALDSLVYIEHTVYQKRHALCWKVLANY